MSRPEDDFEDQVKERSGWLIPLVVFLVTAALSALVLVYYLAPTAPELTKELPAPSAETGRVDIVVGGTEFRIPANYLQFKSARGGGTRTQIALYALLPDMRGYSPAQAKAFANNGPDSEVVNLLIREEKTSLPEKARVERIYLPQTTSQEGAEGPFGLRQYTFGPESGYRDEELYVGETPDGPMALRCTRVGPTAPSPTCLRDMTISPGVALSYRFKRAHLALWKELDEGVRTLIASFLRNDS